MKIHQSLAVLVALTGMTTATHLFATVIPAGPIAGDLSGDDFECIAGQTYNLVGKVTVKSGASLKIPAGVKVINRVADQGTLVVEKGAKIYALGTAASPIIFTSENDPLGVPGPGQDTLGTQEWGNITILDDARISYSRTNGAGTPVAVVQGHVNTAGINDASPNVCGGEDPTDPNSVCGGANDDADSGTLSYVSLRYGSGDLDRNGLCLGAIGRETDIHHVDIWNCIDDGIEVYGGTVNFKYISIWNAGDDSFDVDMGWRGKAQFGLIVQGFGQTTGSQGRGIGDNCFEMDGAEAFDAQPVTTATIYNFTVIGQPDDQGGAGTTGGDELFAWRDCARVQLRNCVFMDIGAKAVRLEASESTTGHYRTAWINGQNYSATGTTGTPGSVLTPAAQWTTAYTVLPTHPATYASGVYTAQSAGNAAIGQGDLNEMTDSVFYNFAKDGGAALTTLATYQPGLLSAYGNVYATNLPIVAYTRAAVTTLPGTLRMGLITHLDPRANNDAVTSVSAAPDGFFTPAQFRGAFSDDVNWALCWTAAAQYGIMSGTNPANPSTTQTVVPSTGFQTTVGYTYVLEKSTDGINWTVVAVVVGDGSYVKIADVDNDLSAATVYRVRVQ